MGNYYARALTVLAEIPYSHLLHLGGINIAIIIPHLKMFVYQNVLSIIEKKCSDYIVISPGIFL